MKTKEQTLADRMAVVNKNGVENSFRLLYNIIILKKYLIKQEAWNEALSSDLVEVCSAPFVKKFTPSF